MPAVVRAGGSWVRSYLNQDSSSPNQLQTQLYIHIYLHEYSYGSVCYVIDTIYFCPDLILNVRIYYRSYMHTTWQTLDLVSNANKYRSRTVYDLFLHSNPFLIVNWYRFFSLLYFLLWLFRIYIGYKCQGEVTM